MCMLKHLFVLVTKQIKYFSFQWTSTQSMQSEMLKFLLQFLNYIDDWYPKITSQYLHLQLMRESCTVKKLNMNPKNWALITLINILYNHSVHILILLIPSSLSEISNGLCHRRTYLFLSVSFPFPLSLNLDRRWPSSGAMAETVPLSPIPKQKR